MTAANLQEVINILENEVEGVLLLDGIMVSTPLFAYLETAIIALRSASARCLDDFQE